MKFDQEEDLKTRIAEDIDEAKKFLSDTDQEFSELTKFYID